MKRILAVLLCIAVMLFSMPAPSMAEGTIQYIAILRDSENPEGPYQLTPIDSLDDLESLDYDGVIIYSLNAEEGPATLSGFIDSERLHGRLVILSDVSCTGHLGYGELILLGNSFVDSSEDEKFIISGSSSSGEAWPALTQDSLQSWDSVSDAVYGAKLKHTITGNKELQEHWHVYDLVVEEGKTLTIKAPDGEGHNGIIIEHSLVVNGILAADEGQFLEIREGCTTVEGVELYDSDGETVFTDYGSFTERFEYTDGQWVRFEGGHHPGGDETQYTITLGYDTGKGRIMLNGSGENPGVYSFNEGENVDIYIETSDGYQISDVIVDGSSVGGVESYQFDNLIDNHTFEVAFSPDLPEQYHITLNYNTDQGNVYIDGVFESGEVIVNEGDSINIDVEARDGYRISTVSIGEDDPINVNNRLYAFQMENINEGKSVTVDFSPITYTITASVGGNGTISPSGEVTLSHDSHQDFIITPDNGYEIDEVLVNGEPVGLHGYVYEFRHVRENHSISVSFKPRGDGSTHTFTVDTVVNGTVEADGLDDGIASVQDGFDYTITIRPDPGYTVWAVMVNDIDETRSVEYKGNGAFEYTVYDVQDDFTLNVIFMEEYADGIVCKSYAVLQEEAQDNSLLKEALAREFGYLGYAISTDRITVYGVDDSDIESRSYGTFKFKVETNGVQSTEQTGYIVPNFSDVIFKYEGAYKGTPISESDRIRIAHAQDGENRLFTAPAMDSGTIEIFGPYYAHMEAWTSPDVYDSFELEGISKLIVKESFYRVQLHIIGNNTGGSPGDPNEDISLNWFAFDLIQDDAFCVKVDATSEEGTQQTLQWALNRYAILNNGNYISQVFFGNDTFELSIPETGIGGVTSISLDTGDFQGYTVSETVPGMSYEVFFKSDFYDRITLDVTINQDSIKQLTIHRVGVEIQKEVYNPDRGPEVYVGHGTQYGTRVDYSDGKYYRIYATYCIPDGGRTAPYGLYVTYTFADGTKTSEIITEYCDNPGIMNAEEYIDGVFIYGSHAACVDYLIYSAIDGSNAPVKVNVTVMKGDPQSGDGDFAGIFFGSGSGVEWIDGQ
jgi:hypothetical protein